jgi:hypothetical protein
MQNTKIINIKNKTVFFLIFVKETGIYIYKSYINLTPLLEGFDWKES